VCRGLTRAAAVDHGRAGIRVNAVALGSIRTERYDAHLAEQSPEAAARTEAQMAVLHPLGRIGRTEEVADTVAYLLSDAAAFVTGAVVPVDDGRAARGADPEEVRNGRAVATRHRPGKQGADRRQRDVRCPA